jgi:CheY-like chemotaxis protein
VPETATIDPPLQVMTVEDQAVEAMALSGALSSLGCNVVGHAYTGGGSILMAEHLQPQLILMDIDLESPITWAQAPDCPDDAAALREPEKIQQEYVVEIWERRAWWAAKKRRKADRDISRFGCAPRAGN